MRVSCLICPKNCELLKDFHCSACQARWHYTCVPYDSCDTVLSDTTVGFWCLANRDGTVNREGQIYDLNYVAFRPYRWIAGVFHPIGQPAISAEMDWCKENWDKIEKNIMDLTFPDDLEERRKKHLEKTYSVHMDALNEMKSKINLIVAREAYVVSYIEQGKYISSDVCSSKMDCEIASNAIRDFMANNPDYHVDTTYGRTTMTVKYTKFL